MQAAKRYDPDEILAGPGIVDYVVGCEPGPGVWALGTIEHPRQRHYLNLYKLGEGPLYCFYTPYHLCHFEVPMTIARAALLQRRRDRAVGAPQRRGAGDRQARPEGGRGHRRARRLHGLRRGRDRRRSPPATSLLPIGVAVGCKLKRDVPKDQALAYADVEVPAGPAGRQAARRAGGAVRAACAGGLSRRQAARPGQSPRRPARRSMCARWSLARRRRPPAPGPAARPRRR